MEAGKREVEAMHEYYWENYTEMDEYGYENFDNQQALLTQVNANAEKHSLHVRYKRLMDSPYFGRVDFIYEGEDEPEIFYIGIGSFSPKKGGGVPLIYDWRAPASSLFYDYDSGEASYRSAGRRDVWRDHFEVAVQGSARESWSMLLRVTSRSTMRYSVKSCLPAVTQN